MRDLLRRFRSTLALSQTSDRDEAGESLGKPMSDLLEEALLVFCPGARPRALVQAEQVSLVAFRMQRHQHLRPHTELLCGLALHASLVTGAGRHGPSHER